MKLKCWLKMCRFKREDDDIGMYARCDKCNKMSSFVPFTDRGNNPHLRKLLLLSKDEKVQRFERMCILTFSHVNGRDLLAELWPRKTLDIKRRIDGKDTWFQGDWLSDLLDARDNS